MTVCIAAMANYGGSIIIATDQMISTPIISADGTAIKILGVHPNWAAMCAGDMAHVAPVLYRVREALNGTEPLYSEVEQAVAKAYAERLVEEQETAVLGRYGLAMNEFLTRGLTMFGPSDFSRLLQTMEQVSLGPDGLDLLVAGYDAKGLPHIFSVSHPGVVENHDVAGFWAIGSGQYSALGSLFFHSYNKRMPSEEALFHVCEAKFMAERASGVGASSSVLTIGPEPGGKATAREIMDLKKIREIWLKEAKPRVPKNLEERMKQIVSAPGTEQTAYLGIRG